MNQSLHLPSLLLTGSTSITSPKHLLLALTRSSFPSPATILTRGHSGVDALAIAYANRHNLTIKLFPAQWKIYGREAESIRASTISSYATHAIIIWELEDEGLHAVLQACMVREVPTYVYVLS